MLTGDSGETRKAVMSAIFSRCQNAFMAQTRHLRTSGERLRVVDLFVGVLDDVVTTAAQLAVASQAGTNGAVSNFP